MPFQGPPEGTIKTREGHGHDEQHMQLASVHKRAVGSLGTRLHILIYVHTQRSRRYDNVT